MLELVSKCFEDYNSKHPTDDEYEINIRSRVHNYIRHLQKTDELVDTVKRPEKILKRQREEILKRQRGEESVKRPRGEEIVKKPRGEEIVRMGEERKEKSVYGYGCYEFFNKQEPVDLEMCLEKVRGIKSMQPNDLVTVYIRRAIKMRSLDLVKELIRKADISSRVNPLSESVMRYAKEDRDIEEYLRELKKGWREENHEKLPMSFRREVMVFMLVNRRKRMLSKDMVRYVIRSLFEMCFGKC